MKIKLTSDWNDYGIVHRSGSVVDVSDRDGEILKAAGHEEMPIGTPARTNPDLYTVGCVPTPFLDENLSRTYVNMALMIDAADAENEAKPVYTGQTQTNKRTKK